MPSNEDEGILSAIASMATQIREAEDQEIMATLERVATELQQMQPTGILDYQCLLEPRSRVQGADYDALRMSLDQFRTETRELVDTTEYQIPILTKFKSKHIPFGMPYIPSAVVTPLNQWQRLLLGQHPGSEP